MCGIYGSCHGCIVCPSPFVAASSEVPRCQAILVMALKLVEFKYIAFWQRDLTQTFFMCD